MFKNEPGCTKFKMADYTFHVPPFGYGWNIETGLLQETYVIKRSEEPLEQYWEREDMMEDYEEKAEDETRQQYYDPNYFVPELSSYRQINWHMRKCGVWVWIKGKPVYLTGLHWMYLMWWQLDVGSPNYRTRDTNIFYFIMYCCLDPLCRGPLWVTKRKEGKTAIAGCWLYELITRYFGAHGGIQSMNDDAAFEFYDKAVLLPWTTLPSFFRPRYDTIGGNLPQKGMYFRNSSVRGKSAPIQKKNAPKALNSKITYGPANAELFDGPKLKGYVSDECFKLKEVDINVRHQKVFPACEIDGEITGKMFYTSTIEDDEDTKKHLKKGNKNKTSMLFRNKILWDGSDPKNRNGNGQTITGLYRYLLPAYETGKVDIYGDADTVAMRIYLENMFASHEHDKATLYSLRRKFPFDERDLFRAVNDDSLFDVANINDRIDAIAPFKGAVQRGNLVWENGIEDTKVVWQAGSTGRWYSCWTFPQEGMSNRFYRMGNNCYPDNDENFVMGCDPFSHSKTIDPRRSDGVAFAKRRYDPMCENDPYNDAFTMMYSARPASTILFHEDMIKMCLYFGCKCLFESNKNNWEDHFIQRGYENFLVKLPEHANYGIPGNDSSADTIVNRSIFYLQKCMNKIWFTGLLDQYIAFDYNDRTPFDKVMAAGYTLISENRFLARHKKAKTEEVADLFMTY